MDGNDPVKVLRITHQGEQRRLTRHTSILREAATSTRYKVSWSTHIASQIFVLWRRANGQGNTIVWQQQETSHLRSTLIHLFNPDLMYKNLVDILTRCHNSALWNYKITKTDISFHPVYNDMTHAAYQPCAHTRLTIPHITEPLESSFWEIIISNDIP